MSDYQVVNPATAEVEKEYPTATDAEVQDALARSAAAYAEWRTTSKDERATILNRVADLYDERADELAAIIAREMGKPLREGKGELQLVASIYRYYADHGAELLAGDDRGQLVGALVVEVGHAVQDRRALVLARRAPLGVRRGGARQRVLHLGVRRGGVLLLDLGGGRVDDLVVTHAQVPLVRGSRQGHPPLPDATHDPGVFTLVEPYDDRGRPGRHGTSRT